MYDTNFLLFPRISNFRKLFVQVDFSIYLSRYKVFVFQQLWCSIEKRSEGDGSNLVRKMVVLFVPNVGLFISCSFLSQSVSNGSSQQHHTVGKKRTTIVNSKNSNICPIWSNLVQKSKILKIFWFFEHTLDKTLRSICCKGSVKHRLLHKYEFLVEYFFFTFC